MFGRLATKLQNISEDNVNAEQLYGQIKGCIHEAVKEALGYKGKQNKDIPEWYSEKIDDRCV